MAASCACSIWIGARGHKGEALSAWMGGVCVCTRVFVCVCVYVYICVCVTVDLCAHF